ncbi:RND transporter [Desulforamulus aquiferis]|nr:efflux RND transporter periplasmic adaptor subunit [Desulforamulus aquiferis]RYD02141.1 RND transporter [Desulforamulus aquiferis]
MHNEAIGDNAQRKKVIGKLGLLFLIGMIFLTFFSNTINNFTLPRVEVARPTNGALIKEIFGEGTIEAKSIWEEYTDSNLRVKDIMVGLGDKVSKGQPILSLDIDSLKSNYQDELARYQQLQLSLAGAWEEQAQKQRDYNNLKYLFELGAETSVNFQNAEKNLTDAERNCENIQLNLEIQARKVESLAKQVENNGVYTAPVDGIITELNFDKGSMANNSMPMFKLADPSQGFRLVVPIASDLADYARPGDTVSVNIFSLVDKKTEGKIERIVDNSQYKGEEKDLWVDVSLEGLTGGEKGQVYLSKKTKQYTTLVPNSAVYNDSIGSYIFVLKSRKGPLGTESYLQKMEVIVEDTDSTKSALTSMVIDEVVIQSNKPVEDGDKVLKEAAN